MYFFFIQRLHISTMFSDLLNYCCNETTSTYMHLSINHQYSTTSVRKYQNYLHQLHVPYYMPRLHWCSIWNLHLDYIFQMRGCSTLKLSNCLKKVRPPNTFIGIGYLDMWVTTYISVSLYLC